MKPVIHNDEKPLTTGEEVSLLIMLLTHNFISAMEDKKNKLKITSFVLLALSILCFIGYLETKAAIPFAMVCISSFFFSVYLFIHSFHLKELGKITNLTRIEWEGVMVPFDDGAILLDLSKGFNETQVNYPTLNQEDQIKKFANRYDNILRKRVILEPLVGDKDQGEVTTYGNESKILSNLETLSKDLSDITDTSISLPVRTSDDEVSNAVLQLIEEFGSFDADENGNVSHSIQNKLHQLEGIFIQKHDDKNKDLTVKLENLLNNLVANFLHQTKVRSESQNFLESTLELYQRITQWPSHNFYCPNCNTDLTKEDSRIITGSKLLYNWSDGSWGCGLCNETIDLLDAIKIHKMKDELFYPILDKMLLENHKDISSIDNDITNQLIQLSKEEKIKTAEISDDARKEINKRMDGLRNLRSKGHYLSSSVRGIVEELESFDKIDNSLKTKYNTRCDNLIAEIKERTIQSQQRIQEETQRMLEEAMAEVKAREISNKKELDKRQEDMKDTIKDAVTRGSCAICNNVAQLRTCYKCQKKVCSNCMGSTALGKAQCNEHGMIGSFKKDVREKFDFQV